jgi:hypothetical protein
MGAAFVLKRLNRFEEIGFGAILEMSSITTDF